jgi:HEAT repeat protein
LIRALSSRNAATRKAAAAALRTAGELNAGAAVDLIAALKDPEIHADVTALLAAFGSDAVGALVRALDSDNAATRLGAVKALGLIGPPAIEAYRPLITRFQKDPDQRVREAAGQAMGEIRKKS